MIACGLLCSLTLGPQAFASEDAAVQQKDGYEIGVRIITASPKGRRKIDKKLRPLKRDLKSLPFKRFIQKDAHKKILQNSEKVSVEFPAPRGKPQLLSIQAHGKQPNGKLEFTLAIAALKFKTRVALPDGGTILVAGPKHKKNTILFSVTAREFIAAAEAAKAQAASVQKAKVKPKKAVRAKKPVRKKK
jgi:hypothetical protein